MKKLLVSAVVLGVVALLAFFWFRVAAPERPRSAASIPAAVMTAFQTAYPNARAVKWTREHGQFEAEFNDGATEKKTWLMFTNAGAVTETEVEIDPAELPAPISARLSTYYKGYDVTEAAIIKPDSGGTIYEAEITQGTNQRDVYLLADGTEVKNTETKKADATGL
ncbi:PepSY-like domain-containing protein [Hymenobacter monticola]|uniref:PepSY-like domain-containing protein n=1 Tax=Hymenobacter monticola TaxID=1705399 RepID=A0ABY4BBU5_9BACT|nr:PepSY-like domain-containing protein [Hymenobacter monticola]UOE36638.1 PepSY-like domain-containing protein [Hymenobacter monticola]